MIFYFSGTGNSFYVAKRIKKQIGGEVIDMAEAMGEGEYRYEIEEGEHIGFVFPVYYYGLPTIVREFIEKLELSSYDAVHIYAVVTCGANYGAADRMLKGLLAEKDMHLSAFYGFPTVDNFIFGYDLQNKEEQEQTLKNAEGRLMTIIKSLSLKGKSDKPSTLLERVLTKAVYPIYEKGRNTRNFYADNRCISCNLCEEICPSKAIEMVDGKPKWIKDQCIHCVACINRCPVEAIQYGQSTKKRNRYVHPILK
ncbi:MAG: 4Fe-4S dicluster domain-containing protein [Clostridia bacterium]|nr:4Fe-4S dicluster domain-containing protein [Clostridia bacterium]